MIRADPATIYDVARLAGVSPSTVSHVLNSTRKVSLATRRRVEDAIEALSYRPNDSARMLRAGHTKLIGLVLPDISNTYFADLARALEMLAYAQGARLLTCNSDYERDREAAYVDDLVRRRVDGILIAPVAPDAEVEAALQKTGVPIILIDRVPERCTLPSIGIDNAAAAALAAEHLYSLGHRRIGCICAQPGLAESVDQRTRGFIDGLARRGITLPEAAIGCGDFKISGGMEAASRLLIACPDLTAIFCTNDPMAVGAVKAAAAAGRAVPEDLSIIGFDDSLEAQVSQPPLTTIAQPIEEIAAGAMALLRGGGKGEQRLRLSARLVIRHSAAPATDHSARSDAPTPPVAAGRDARPAQTWARKRILIAGAGRIGRVHARALARIPGAVIAGFSDPDAARAAALAREFGSATFDQVDAALAGGDVDAIIVGSSSDAHLELVRRAAQHGVHVFCEKPLALTAADIAVAIAACEEAGVILQVGFNRRFDPNVAEISASVRDGRIGKPLSIRIVSRDPAPPPRDFLRRSGGLFHDLAIHDFDLAGYVLGEEVVEVMAMGGCLIDPMFAEEGDVDVATTTLRFASGALGVVENTRATPYGYDQRLEVLGTEGALESENQTAHRVIFRSPAGQAAPLPLPFFLERYETAFQRQMQAFVELLAAAAPRAEPVASGKDALRAHLIADAATDSLRSGMPARVAVPKT